MSEAHRLTLVDPFRVANSGGHPEEFDFVAKTCLAQGDSWFSIGSLPPGVTSNLLAQMEVSRSVAVVNCARPGIQLAHMSDTSNQKMFLRLLTGKLAVKWDAILFSGGGNDLIDAAGVGPDAKPELRLLATVAERGSGPLVPDDYVSEAGWQTFQQHFTAVFNALVALRDSGLNRQVPMVFHTYAHIMPRPAPVGAGKGPWLHPAMLAFSIPPEAWLPVSSTLMDRLADLLKALIAAHRAAEPSCELHVVDSRSVPILLGDRTASGESGDFLNEIHPTRTGYSKLGTAWRQTMDAIFV